jgi:hypothetical protein
MGFYGGNGLENELLISTGSPTRVNLIFLRSITTMEVLVNPILDYLSGMVEDMFVFQGCKIFI